MELDYQKASNSDRTVYFGDGSTEKLSSSLDPIMNLSTIISVGYSYLFFTRYEALIEPVFRYYFREYVVTGSNLYSVGLRITLNGAL